MRLHSETTSTCQVCSHWGNYTKTKVGCKIMRKWYNPLSSACFLADMTMEDALHLGESKFNHIEEAEYAGRER